MSTDPDGLRFARPLAALTFALILSATATLASAAGVLAAKPSAEVTFSSHHECVMGRVSTVFGTTAKGRWWYLRYQSETIDSEESVHWFSPKSEFVKRDSKAPIAVIGHHSGVGPVTTTFHVVLTDRKGNEVGLPQTSPAYVCPWDSLGG